MICIKITEIVLDCIVDLFILHFWFSQQQRQQNYLTFATTLKATIIHKVSFDHYTWLIGVISKIISLESIFLKKLSANNNYWCDERTLNCLIRSVKTAMVFHGYQIFRQICNSLWASIPVKTTGQQNTCGKTLFWAHSVRFLSFLQISSLSCCGVNALKHFDITCCVQGISASA